MDESFITLKRKMMSWEWYSDIKVFKLFLHCLFKANHADKIWRGQSIKRGQFITSVQKLSLESGLSIQEVRTALKKLEKTGELTNTATNKNSLITVNNYEKEQAKQQAEQQTNNKHSNKPLTTTNNNNNDLNNENNIYTNACEFITKEIEPYLNRYKMPEDEYQRFIHYWASINVNTEQPNYKTGRWTADMKLGNWYGRWRDSDGQKEDPKPDDDTPDPEFERLNKEYLKDFKL